MFGVTHVYKMTEENQNHAWLEKIKNDPKKSWNVSLIQESRQGNLWRVQQLLKLGANTRFRGGAALNAAVEKGHLHIVQQLMSFDDLKLAFICEHMNKAVSQRHYHLAAYFVNNFNPPASYQIDPEETQVSMMCILAERGEKDLLEACISKGLNPMAQNGILFRSAAKMGQNNILHMLLDMGFDLKADKGGAAILAVNNNRISTLDLLLTKGTDPNMEEDILMKTALLYDHAEAVTTLARHGGKVDENQYQALYDAMIHERSNCFATLLACGADTILQHEKVVTQIEESGKTGIIKAVKNWQKNQITENDFTQITSVEDLTKLPSDGSEPFLIKAVKSHLLYPLCQYLQKQEIPLSMMQIQNMKDHNGISICDLAHFKKSLGGLFHPHLWQDKKQAPQNFIDAHFTPYQQRDPDLQKSFNQLCLAQSKSSVKNLQLKRRRRPGPRP